MKRWVCIVLTALIILFPSMLAAEGSEPTVLDSGTLTFRGYIQPGLYFSVNPITEESFNLLTNVDLLPTGLGVDIGQWTLRVDNPPIEELSYTIQYTYSAMENTNDSINDTIEFVVLERPDGSTERTLKENEDISQVTISLGLNIDSRIFSVRFTDNGAESAFRAAASDDYIAYIVVSLITEN